MMLKVLYNFLSLLLFMTFLVGCGSTTPAAAGSSPSIINMNLPAVYVNVTMGSNVTGNGTAAAPFKTITQALASTTPPANIFVSPGLYNTAVGEVFPIMMKNGVNLVGNIMAKGAGAAPTIISTNGAGGGYILTGGTNTVWMPAGGYGVTVVFPPGITATLAGFTITNAFDYDVLVDNANATIDSNSIIKGPLSFCVGIGSFNNSNSTITNNIVGEDKWYALVDISDAGSAYLRNNYLVSARAGCTAIGIAGGGTTATSPNVDIGNSATTSGNNTILGGTSAVGIWLTSTKNPIVAYNNTWHPNIQGANTSGKYPGGLFVSASNTAFVAGGNYYNPLSTTSIQLYTQPGVVTGTVPSPRYSH